MRDDPTRGTGDDDLDVARARRGDRTAFNRLVERHQGLAYATALRMLGDPDAAADVTQDAFLSAYRAIGTFRGASFRAWLLRIVANACYDVFRARGRHPEESLDALLDAAPGDDAPQSPGTLAALVDQSPTPETAVLRAEVARALEAAILRLPPEYRLALILCDVQGLPYDEIARVLDVPMGTVKSRIARARSRLRDLLARQGDLFGQREGTERDTAAHREQNDSARRHIQGSTAPGEAQR